MKKEKERYEKVDLSTKKLEYMDVSLTKQDITRTYTETDRHIKVSYTAKGWWSDDNFHLSREKVLNRYSGSGEWDVGWSSGGFDDTIDIIDRLETVQQIMEDMKYFLEHGEFLKEYKEIDSK